MVCVLYRQRGTVPAPSHPTNHNNHHNSPNNNNNNRPQTAHTKATQTNSGTIRKHKEHRNMTAHPDFIKAWTKAVNEGLIKGNPAYYYNGEATPEEYHHALITALLEVNGTPWDTPIITPPPPPVEGTVLTPANWQTVIQSNGPTFIFTEGTYTNFTVTPKPGQRFYADDNANITLDGGGRSTAFASSKTSDVVIDGRAAAGGYIKIRNYQGLFYRGVINNLLSGDWYGDGNDKPSTWVQQGWQVRGVHLTDCGPHGITLCGNYAELTDFIIDGTAGKTLEVGWKMLYGYDQLVADGECFGARPTNWGNEGGGCKNWNTIGLVVERVKSYGHTGPGIWHDFNNFESTIRDCEVWDCTGPGLFQEISVESQRVDGRPAGVSVIENNVVRDMRNSTRWGGVEVATAGPVVVRNNIIRNSKAGIWFRDQGGRSPHTGHTAGEVYGNVLDNAGASGYLKESGQGGVVTWNSNQYLNGSSGP